MKGDPPNEGLPWLKKIYWYILISAIIVPLISWESVSLAVPKKIATYWPICWKNLSEWYIVSHFQNIGWWSGPSSLTHFFSYLCTQQRTEEDKKKKREKDEERDRGKKGERRECTLSYSTPKPGVAVILGRSSPSQLSPPLFPLLPFPFPLLSPFLLFLSPMSPFQPPSLCIGEKKRDLGQKPLFGSLFYFIFYQLPVTCM